VGSISPTVKTIVTQTGLVENEMMLSLKLPQILLVVYV
jgi:hypothetical protein